MKRLICLGLSAFVVCALLCGCTKKAEPSESSAQVEGPAGHAEIVNQLDCSYEEYLAAAGLSALTVQYEGFEPKKILCDSKHSINDAAQSKGVYLIYNGVDGEQCLHLYYLEKERTEAGTMDLYSQSVGYAAMDEASIEEAEKAGFTETTVDALEPVIKQLLLTTILEH